MPAMTPQLAKEVQRSLCELFANIFVHANSPCGGLAIGQFYPKKRQIQICVCDGGIGIVRRVQDAGYGMSSPGEALAWALEEGTTTRSDASGPPGGLGLFLLREFVKLNGGALRVVANNGYLCLEAGRPNPQSLPVEFPGTLFQVKLNIRDDVVYTIAPTRGSGFR
jgi:anti-sigma regulatory factor (Ser/Thr protein kinase)